jgi:hypothetical protein
MIKTKKAISVLTGMVLGDGSLSKPKGNSVMFKLTHGINQKDYLIHKRDILEEIFEKKINIHEFDNGGYPGCRIEFGNKYFKPLRKFIYPNGVKTITKKVLNRLDAEGIAYWYMDDGNLTLHKNKGEDFYHSREIYLNTYVSYEEALLIKDFFYNRYNIDFRIAASKGWYRHVCNTKNTKRFIHLVEPYIISSMQYKIDMKYKNKNQADVISAQIALDKSNMK